MSNGQLARNRALSMGSGRSSKGQNGSMADFRMAPTNIVRDFEPCDATGAMMLYGSGNQVVVCHHDTLKIERRFSRHTDEVRLLVVDNVSERGAGRLALSYDAGQTAIVWDLMTGDEIARFASYNDISVAAWMRNGNVAFGNADGNVVIFEPTTSEHISARTIDQVPITAIAPAADCRTYAIGYQNGSLLIASLQPRFSIIHHLSTSRAPSPIVSLAWHASSARAKSDMLATQTHDGDLRVWSVAKSAGNTDGAKVVRVLKRGDGIVPGPNWMGWSKNGRIIQFSEGECISWDVRNKNVSHESVPVLAGVRGIALYGPGATLFTLGQNNSVQQFDLNSPPGKVCDKNHPAPTLPPSPPVSIEEQKQSAAAAAANELSSVPVNIDVVSESDEDHMSPLARLTSGAVYRKDRKDSVPDRSDALSPVSTQASYTSRTSIGSRGYRRHGSVTSRGMSDHTVMSLGSSFHSREPSLASSRDTRDNVSMGSSASGSSYRSRGRSSRLRQEVLRSPEDTIVVDLFRFTKSRLSDIPYAHPQLQDNKHLTIDELRRQMLRTIFGFEGDAQDLIRDEIQRHALGSPNRILLNKWLGELDTDIMASSSQSMTSSDWMLLALSGIGGQASQQKVARAYVQRLLEKGDVHTAATIMIGMGDQNDAIEIYVSHRRYMEALILACYVYPADWGRQTQLIRRWGEWAVQHSQQQLAIRCFSCTGSDSFDPYASPAPQTLTFAQTSSSIPEMLSPPLSPPGVIPRGPQRNIGKTAALRLVTTFGEKGAKSKFFGADGDKTPMGGVGATPIAESALEEDGQTAFIRAPLQSMYNTPSSAARTATPGGYTRGRLPSIGEMPTDVVPRKPKTNDSSRTTTDEDTNSETSYRSYRSRGSHHRKASGPDSYMSGNNPINRVGTSSPSVSRASTASPMMQKAQATRADHPLPSPSPAMFSLQQRDARDRNGSRDRKPVDLHIQWPPLESILTGKYMTTPVSSSDLILDRPTTGKSASGSVTGSVSSMSTGGRSLRNDAISPPLTGSSLDPYISSLEVAKYEKAKLQARDSSRDARDIESRARSVSRKREVRSVSEDRGRTVARYLKSGKRSPTSPVPMSPEDLKALGANFGYDDNRSETSSTISDVRRRNRDGSQSTAKPGSRTTSRMRRMSPEPLKVDTNVSSRPASRQAQRGASRIRKDTPDPAAFKEPHVTRGIIEQPSENSRDTGRRSPPSPVPMSPDSFYRQQSELKSLSDSSASAKTEQSRVRSRQRSVSQARGPSATRRTSPEPKVRSRSTSRQGRVRDSSKTREATKSQPKRAIHKRSATDLKVGDLQQMKLDRQRKKESAAKELEERRKSLVRRPSVPPIIHPDQLSPALQRPSSRSEGMRSDMYQPPNLIVRSQTVSPESMRLASARFQEPARSAAQIGLPATPRAMQHPKYDPENKEVPAVPQIPETYITIPTLSIASLNDVPSPGKYGTLPQTTFTPLPKTTYQAAARQLSRAMSAPPAEDSVSPKGLPSTLPTHFAFQAAIPSSSRRRNDDTPQFAPTRKIYNGQSQPGTRGYETRNNQTIYPSSFTDMGGIDATIASVSASQNMTPPPPPPPPAPPILPQLQHLSRPPPPPPAPLYRMVSSGSDSGISHGPGIIEIVLDNDDGNGDAKPGSPIPVKHDSNRNSSESSSSTGSRSSKRSQNNSDNIPPPPPPPPAPLTLQPQVYNSSQSSTTASRQSLPRLQTQTQASAMVASTEVISPAKGHNRGRSQNDNSISSRFSRATERMRSGSRGPGTLINRTISPPIETQSTRVSPYESVINPSSRYYEGLQRRGSGEAQTTVIDNGAKTERHPRDVRKEAMENGMF